jgi:hypothetical protein
VEYAQIPLGKRNARGRNGVFSSELMEVSINTETNPATIVIEIWSRRRKGDAAPIRFELSIGEAANLASHLEFMTDREIQRRVFKSLGKEE